jgi:hypothetical protein
MEIITLVSVLEAFKFTGLNKNAYYKWEEILAALDKLSGKQFDRNLAEELFEHCTIKNKKC